MFSEKVAHASELRITTKPGKSNKNHAGRYLAKSKNQFPKVTISG